MKKIYITVLIIAILQMSIIENSSAQASIQVIGAGATFPQPLIEYWGDIFAELTAEYVTVSYGGGGSGNGISQITENAVNFGASDAPLSKTEQENTNKDGKTILQIPETMGAVVPVYNIPSDKITGPLNLTADIIAKIFQRQITTWSDSEITIINPGLTSTADILVVHRSDKSGTTFAFTDYLDRASDLWTLGASKQPDWATDTIGGNGNAGVASSVLASTNSIGYVELTYVLTNDLLSAHLKNKAGVFVAPSNAGVTAAAASASVSLPAGDGDWSNISIADQDGADVWPISTLTYLLVYKDQTSFGETGGALVAFLTWLMTEEAQNLGIDIGYAPLPNATRTHNMNTINSIILEVGVNPLDYAPLDNIDGDAPGFEFISFLGIIILSIVLKINKKNRNKK